MNQNMVNAFRAATHPAIAPGDLNTLIVGVIGALLIVWVAWVGISSFRMTGGRVHTPIAISMAMGKTIRALFVMIVITAFITMR